MNLELKEIITYFARLFIVFNTKILDNTYSKSTTPSTTHNLNIMIDI